MEIFTAEMMWYIATAIALVCSYVYFARVDRKKYQDEINGWEKSYNWLNGEYTRLQNHSNWLDSSLKRMTFKYDEEVKIKGRILEQARLWKAKYERAEHQITQLEDCIQVMDFKNKELHKKIINDSRPLQGTKKTWKIKKPNTISRSQVYRRKKEVCE